jgi:predicted 2-oxoglutarate/Fe(II)-dependent dioxygenase YbiX
LIFVDQLTNEKELTIQPKAGRVVIFTSGPENTHYVERVTSGNRFVLAFWFTCDNNKQFEIFLDGKRHMEFSHKVRNALNAKTKHKPPSQDKEL